MSHYPPAPLDKDQRILLDERQVAEFLGIKPDTIRKWRVFKKGPRAIKIGHLVRYQMVDIEAWIATCPERPAALPQVPSTSSPGEFFACGDKPISLVTAPSLPVHHHPRNCWYAGQAFSSCRHHVLLLSFLSGPPSAPS